jgi:hypothetical protein
MVEFLLSPAADITGRQEFPGRSIPGEKMLSGTYGSASGSLRPALLFMREIATITFRSGTCGMGATAF